MKYVQCLGQPAVSMQRVRDMRRFVRSRRRIADRLARRGRRLARRIGNRIRGFLRRRGRRCVRIKWRVWRLRCLSVDRYQMRRSRNTQHLPYVQYVSGLALRRGEIGHGGLPGSFDDDTRSDHAQRPIRPRTLELGLLWRRYRTAHEPSYSVAARAMPRVQVRGAFNFGVQLPHSTHEPSDIIGAVFARTNENRPSKADIFRSPNETGV
jgi:hypothetical protein